MTQSQSEIVSDPVPGYMWDRPLTCHEWDSAVGLARRLQMSVTPVVVAFHKGIQGDQSALAQIREWAVRAR